MTTIYIVTAEHWDVPGCHVDAFISEDDAQRHALSKLNKLLNEAGKPSLATWTEADEALDFFSNDPVFCGAWVEINEAVLHDGSEPAENEFTNASHQDFYA